MINPEAITPDADLERRIDLQAHLMWSAPTPDEQLAAWEVLKDLVARRSPEQVAQMERRMGLG